MLHKLYQFHPGLVGAVVGFTTGALYSMWWFDSKSAGAVLSDAETAWLLLSTVAVVVCFPLLMAYFAYFSYLGLQTTSTKSASDSWKTIAVIVFSLSFGYSLSFVVLLEQPIFISNLTMWALYIGYVAIVAALLYLIFNLPWVTWGRVAKRNLSEAEAHGERFDLNAKIMDMKVQQHQDLTEKAQE